ncbi:hypothetical protein PS685_05034 [Pseudomonas fluorescens]|uniref:Uncharacterized protein n=1 Tax=Pseudomonas fluorescens TaxID=294 RepID=A0A5E7A5W1_PSEFL|nr:hypothetical protein PS685_05034 [Pseudomonas fluorescens]
MRHVPQLFSRARHTASQYWLLGCNVEQGVLHLQATACRHDIAYHYVLGTQGFPVAENDFAGLGRQADHVLLWNRRVVTRVAQVIADNFSHVVRQQAAALVAEWNDGDRSSPIAAAGDQNVFFICCRHTCQAADNDKHSSKKVSHKARSSGVNVILNDR